MMYFPIYRLNGAITETLKKIISLDIAEGIREGLNPMIHFVDEQGGPYAILQQAVCLSSLNNCMLLGIILSILKITIS